MTTGNIETFRLPPIQGEAALSLPDKKNFILQTFDGNAPARSFYSEKELTSMAERILAEAEEKRQHIEQEAYEEGFRQGQKDGREVAQRGLEEIIQRFENLLKALMEEKATIYRHRERDLVELVRLICRKLVHRELSIHPELIRDLVESGFQKLFEAERLKLLVHPQDYELLTRLSRESWPPGLELVPDGSMTPGGFMLKTDRGDLDGTLEVRWARVDEAIDKILGISHADESS